jgi:vacuolar-type H+-ATPase subunit F/Vma7
MSQRYLTKAELNMLLAGLRSLQMVRRQDMMTAGILEILEDDLDDDKLIAVNEHLAENIEHLVDGLVGRSVQFTVEGDFDDNYEI